MPQRMTHDRPRGLIGDMRHGFGDLRGSTRERIARHPRPGEVYAWLAASGLLVYATDLIAKAAGARAAGEIPSGIELAEWTTAAMLGSLAVLPAAVAAAAVPVWLLLRHGFGGGAGFGETAVAAAWAALLAAPILALASLLQAGSHLVQAEAFPRKLAVGVFDAAALVLAARIWAQCTAAAHGFRTGWPLFGVAVSPIVAGWWIAGMSEGS